MKIIIDASSNSSGGGKRHLKEILNEFTNPNNNIEKIYVWGPKSLLGVLPKSTMLIKKTSFFLNAGSFGTIIWQLIFRDKDFKKIDFDCIYSPFGNYTGKLKPYVTMSQNMLMFEKKERKKFGFSLARLRLKILYYVQKKSFINSSGIIFLSEYAKKIISNKLNFKFKSSVVINHGIASEFNKPPKEQLPISKYSFEKPFKFLYVSNILPYKYHLNVINSINELVQENFPVQLTLVGKVDSVSLGKKVNNLICKVNKNIKIINWYQNISIDEVKKYYHDSDCFIFASSCENMPNILIEAMSSGLPIVCSNLGPMKEFLKDSGIYFNPIYNKELKNALIKTINDKELRTELSTKSYKLSFNYDWEKCAKETISFILKNKKIL